MMHKAKLSKSMQQLFHDCTEKQDYTEFFNKYRNRLDSIANALKYVSSGMNKRCYFIALNFTDWCCVLRNYKYQYPNCSISGTYHLEINDFELFSDMRSAINKKNWSCFYNKYHDIVDLIINEARRQNFLDICIELGDACYPDFKSRDYAIECAYRGVPGKSDPYLSKYSGEAFKAPHSKHSKCTSYTEVTVYPSCQPTPNKVSAHSDRYGTPRQYYPTCQNLKNEKLFPKSDNHENSSSSPSYSSKGVSSGNQVISKSEKTEQFENSGNSNINHDRIGLQHYDSLNNRLVGNKSTNDHEVNPSNSIVSRNATNKTLNNGFLKDEGNLERETFAKTPGKNLDTIEHFTRNRVPTPPTRELTEQASSSLNPICYTQLFETYSSLTRRSTVNNDDNKTSISMNTPTFSSDNHSSISRKPRDHFSESKASEHVESPAHFHHNDLANNKKFEDHSFIQYPANVSGSEFSQPVDRAQDNTYRTTQEILLLEKDYMKQYIEAEKTSGPHAILGMNKLEQSENPSSDEEQAEQPEYQEPEKSWAIEMIDKIRQSSAIEPNIPDENYDNDFFQYEAELSNIKQQADEIVEKEDRIKEELQNMQKIKMECNEINSPDFEENSSFEQILREQRERHARELEEKRKERKRRQEELEKELRKLRQESKERFEMLYRCIILKQSFEVQEENWSYWIQGCRNHLVALHRYFLQFDISYQNVHGRSKHSDEDDLMEFQKDQSQFVNILIKTYNALEDDFLNLNQLEKHFTEASFLRVLQKCLADVASQLLNIANLIETTGVDRHSYETLHGKMGLLKADSIHSTTKLRSISLKTKQKSAKRYNLQRIHIAKKALTHFTMEQLEPEGEKKMNILRSKSRELSDEDSDIDLKEMKEDLQKKITEQNKFYENELKLLREKRDQMNKDAKKEMQAILNTKNSLSEFWSLEQSDSYQDKKPEDSSFKQMLQSEKERHARELEVKTKERKEELEEKLQKLKQESKERFEMLYRCMNLKQSFEVQEENWSCWIQGCRNHLIALHRYFLQFDISFQNVYGHSKHSEEDDLIEFQKEKNQFINCGRSKNSDEDDLIKFQKDQVQFVNILINTYNALEDDFLILNQLENHYTEASFLRVLQKCLADVACQLLDIVNFIETTEIGRDSYETLHGKMRLLKADSIYSTAKLRSICPLKDHDKTYKNVEFPKMPSNLIVEEV